MRFFTALVLSLVVAIFTTSAFAGDLTMKITALRDGESRVLPAGADLVIGDEVMMTFVPPMDGFLFLFSCGPEGSVYQLVPDEDAPMPATVLGAVKKGQTIDVGMFPVAPPAGTERLLVMFGPERLDIPALRVQAVDFFARWRQGEDVSHYVWHVGTRKVGTARSRGLGDEIYYTSAAQETEAAPVIIGQVTLRSVEALPVAPKPQVKIVLEGMRPGNTLCPGDAVQTRYEFREPMHIRIFSLTPDQLVHQVWPARLDDTAGQTPGVGLLMEGDPSTITPSTGNGVEKLVVVAIPVASGQDLGDTASTWNGYCRVQDFNLRMFPEEVIVVEEEYTILPFYDRSCDGDASRWSAYQQAMDSAPICGR